MKPSALPQLNRIAEAVLERVRLAGGVAPMMFTNFHGFLKSGLPNDVVGDVLRQFGLTPEMVQIEVAGVLTDLTHEIHTHQRTEAHVTCIGEDFGLPNPRGGYAFLRDRWVPVKLGDVFQIAVNVAHGFTVDPGGILYFLSVQSQPLVSPDGQEDYVAQPFTRWLKEDFTL